MNPSIEEIKRRLIQAGASPQAVESLEPEFFEDLTEDMDFEGTARVINFIDYLENFENYKRKRVNITLAVPVYEVLKHIASKIVDADGRPYPVSYLIEDIIVWVLKDPDRFVQFVEETYPEEDNDESEETHSEIEEQA
uniref:Tn2-9p n=2 Tax=Thermococcus nautili TaxID=195522 RepID=D6MY03_9EURY|nr:tn2-9p [Thermococcus nautili]